MKFISTLTLLCLTEMFVLAQGQKKATVTDLNFIRRTGIHVNDSTFPFYFHHKEFIRDVQSDIQKYLYIYFNVEQVDFATGENIKYTESIVAPKTSALLKARTSNNPDNYYVKVETILQEAAEVNGVLNYTFLTRIKIFGKSGTLIYRFRNRIPFVVILDEQITGQAEMGEQDFYTFYFDGLEMAFEGKHSKSEKRYITKPPTKYYSTFLDSAQKFYIKRNGKTYSYGAAENDLKQVFKFDEDISSVDLNEALSLADDKYIMDKYRSMNLFNSDKLSFWLDKIGDPQKNQLPSGNWYSVKVMDKNKEVGTFVPKGYSVVEGKMFYTNYRFKWNNNYFATEVYINGKLCYLIDDLEAHQVIYIHDSITEKQLGDLFNLFFIHDYMDAVNQR